MKMSKLKIPGVAKLSQLYQPVASTFNTSNTFKSYENLIKYGIIAPLNSGMYSFLPMGLRVINKMINLVDKEMERVGAQKLLLPALIPSKLWKQTGRYEDNNTELFKLQDRRNKNYILSPTCEEAICQLLSTKGVLSPTILPLKLYQIATKWRDEMKPRYGFMRSREFLMKDLYTFDATLDNAQETYALICEAYDNIFQEIGIPFVKAIGDTGAIGGLMSHEYHYVNHIGEDIICTCSSCQYFVNKVICKDSHCPLCKKTFIEQQVTEVAHSFLLDTKYTKPLNVMCKSHGETLHPLVMSCFGLGLSRIFTIMVEILSKNDELRWPKNLAPYTVCIIIPKSGSKEESASQYVNQILEILNQLNIDIIIDDRTNLTIGNRFIRAKLVGYSYIIVIGKIALRSPPLFEIHDINNSTQTDVSLESIHSYFQNENTKNSKDMYLV